MDACCGGACISSYQSQVSNSGPYSRLWVTLVGAQAEWNDAAWLNFYYAWKEGGRAPGHLHYLLASTTPNNGCTNQRFNLGYETPFGEQMWAAFKNVPSPSPTPQCSDGIDNDLDTFIEDRKSVV